MRMAVRKLKNALESGYMTFLIGLALVATSLFEMVDSGIERALGVEIQAHHGVLIWGVAQLFKGLSAVVGEVKDLREGLEDVSGEK